MNQPRRQCNKSGELVMDVMRYNHPDTCLLTGAILNSYPSRPLKLVTFNMTEYKATDISGHLSGCAGTGGGGFIDSPALAPLFRVDER